MPKQVKEVHKFDKGIHGSISELDISAESASLSLNVDPNSEYGALRGIYGDKILSEGGWEVPRYAKWDIKFFGPTSSSPFINKVVLDKKLFLIHAFDKQFLLLFTFDKTKVENRFGGDAADNSLGNIGIHSDLFASTEEYDIANSEDRIFNVIPIILDSVLLPDNTIQIGKIADSVKTALNYAVPSNTLESVSGYSTYFYCYRPSIYATQEELNNDGTLTIKSNFYGDISMPELPTDIFPTGGAISGTDVSHTSGLYLPNSEIYTTNATNFVSGNGYAVEQTLDGINEEETKNSTFVKLKAFNSKDSSNILGITKTSQVKLYENISASNTSDSINLGSIATTAKNSLSIEQRNKNLYLGAGDSQGTSSIWIGYINRTQLNKDFEGYYLEKNKLDSFSESVGANDFDNIIVPTLHHGLNSTNGGVAGAASLYVDTSGDDVYGTSIDPTSGTIQFRSVNSWVHQCLQNNSAATYRYNDVKEGMIFRVNLGNNYIATDYSFSSEDGKNAHDYLYDLKQLAVGKINNSGDNVQDETSLYTGGEGEALHDGDLFQVVYSLGSDSTIAENSNNGTTMFRLVYIGSLFGKATGDANHPSYADSDDAYCGIPAYAYAHANDSSNLSRIKTTSKPDDSIERLYSDKGGIYSGIEDSEDNSISFSDKRVESIDLRVELGISDFEISTIAECKSSDGNGGFGGDTSNKNYHMGHGKLWVANKNEHDVLYLIDVTNWDKINAKKARITYTKINLAFDRIHNVLLSHRDTSYGKGLIRLAEKDSNGWQTQDAEKAYFENYLWNPVPEGQYISSICETYSHLPHLGDGAGGGAANGDGKWRVWVEYKKDAESAHIRYDLFLFNFRVQPWNVGDGQDEGVGITSTNKTVYMFDKTPPYQECQKVTLGRYVSSFGSYDLYYPFDKFSLTNYAGDNKREKLNGTSGTEIWGKEYAQQAKNNSLEVGAKLLNGDSADFRRTAKFRNPSGEYRVLYAPEKTWSTNNLQRKAAQTVTLPLGSNLGWYLNQYREYIPVRHSLKPYYRKWYFTGNQSSGTGVNQIPYPEEESYTSTTKKTFTAHVVSSFGRLSGMFIAHGGTLLGTHRRNSQQFFNNDNNWFSHEGAVTKTYDNDYVTFSLHDSPVAIESYNGTAYEVQGRPSTTVGTETIELTNSLDRLYYADTEAGFMGSRAADDPDSNQDEILNKSVPATMGYSRYNQYRYHHANNGTDSLTDDNGNGEAENYNTVQKTYGYGGQYFGKDHYGHYINITQTWASNQDYMLQSSKPEDATLIIGDENDFESSDQNEMKSHARGHGWGDGAYFKDNNKRSGDGRYWDGNVYPESDIGSPTEAFSKYGTGYFTYQANTNSTSTTDTDYSGFYSNSANTDNSSDFIIPGSHWDNRRIVQCWSTTALTDSIHNINYKQNRSSNNYIDHREWGLWKTPRCSFRKILTPSTFGSNVEIINIDTITWSERNVNSPNVNTDNTNDNTVMKSGYLIQFSVSDSNDNNSDNSSTAIAVYETKNSSVYAYNSDHWPFEEEQPYQSHSKSATDYLRILYKPNNLLGTENNYGQYFVYKNKSLITKNLVPGLSDMLTGVQDSTIVRFTKLNQKPFNILEERYSPIALSKGGSEDKQEISIWVRGQFKENNKDIALINDMGGFPYYKCDKLWNYWSLLSGQTKGFDRSTSDFNGVNYITEGWGSTAGSGNDNQYPSSYYLATSPNQAKNKEGAHIKTSETIILSNEGEVEVATDEGFEFEGGTDVYYKFSLLYDGFQESALNKNAISIPIEVDCSLVRLKLTVPNSELLKINSRVTHINVYRKNKQDELFRLVKSISLNTSKEAWGIEDDKYILNFNDEGRFSSYEGLNGIPESLTNLTPNYRLSCQLNDFLFVGGLYHPNLEDGDHLLLRSKQGRFSVFDWSNDFLDIPTKPVAMAAFANRVWVFDENNMYKINPTGLYIEDKTEGIGILNSESFIVTDMGMFWCDRNNIYKHDGKQINQIGTSILKNHSHPEWQIGYLDAVNKSETLGYTPKIGYDPINQSIYITLQGFSKSLLSYKQYESRIYSYDIKQDRWDYYESPTVKSITTDSKGNVVISDGFQLYNYRRDKKNRKKFSWDSKTFQLGSSNYDKSLKELKFTGDLCLWNFNNGALNTNTRTDTGEDIVDDVPDFSTGDNTHILEVSNAAETDDLKVYVDGILQTMRIKSKNPVLGPPIANDSNGEIYSLDSYLPTFNTISTGSVYADSFKINTSSCPEFLTWPNGQFKNVSLEGELDELIHIHKGMYLYFKGEDVGGIIREEIVRVRDIKFGWVQTSVGKNEISYIEILCWRGQLGTKALDWNALANKAPDVNPNYSYGENIEPIRTANPTFLFPRGLKGKTVKISLQNQKSFIDSFAMSYRVKKFK